MCLQEVRRYRMEGWQKQAMQKNEAKGLKIPAMKIFTL
jgi:hypothetical protein